MFRRILQYFSFIAMSLFAAQVALAELSGTDMFNERPKARSFDAESKIDAIKRERIQAQRESIDSQRKNHSKELSDFCKCVTPFSDCAHSPITLFQRGKNESYEAYSARQRKILDKQRIVSDHRKELSKQCGKWMSEGDEASQQFRRQMQAMDVQMQQELEVENRLYEQRMGKIKAEQAYRQQEKDDIQRKLKNQRDAVNDANRIKYLESKRKAEAALDKNRAFCRAALAAGRYPCACDLPKGYHSCEK